MCIKVTVATFVSVIAVSALAWTEAETNSVVRELISLYGRRNVEAIQDWMKAGNVVDFGPLTEEVEELPRFERIAWPTAESLFGYPVSTNIAGWCDWSSDDRRRAFEVFLSSLTNRDWSVAQQSDIRDAVGALELCRGFDMTNATSIAKELTASARVPILLRVSAAQLYFGFSGDRSERNGLVADILTNRIACAGISKWDMNQLREGVYALQCDALNGDIDANLTNGVYESVRMLYSNLDFPSRAEDLDALLLKLYPTYVTSSNRLAVAQKLLSSNIPASHIVEYFSPITNMLMNSAQPLPAVDGL